MSVGATALLAILTVATPASAHGFGERYDLPVPLWLWVAGAAMVVVLSFVVIGVFVRGSPTAGRYPRANLLRWRAARLSSTQECGSPVGSCRLHCWC